MKNNKGITLIALVITVIVLLILAGVSISMLSGDNGILRQVAKAKTETEEQSTIEQIKLSVLETITKQTMQHTIGSVKELKTVIAKQLEVAEDDVNVDGNESTGYAVTTNGVTYKIKINGDVCRVKTPIKKSTETADSYVGYYADIDDDGIADGIIYADLVTGAIGDGQWTNSEGNYTITTINSEESKNYYISKTGYDNGKFGTNDIISPVGTGKDRFYIMALEDFTPGTKYCWYNSAFGNMSDSSPATTSDFGAGKANTDTMIEKWNNESYGPKNGNSSYLDMWGMIQTEVDKGWFVPSRAEWSAFVEELGISTTSTDNNYYVNKGLRDDYWLSSQIGPTDAFRASFTYNSNHGFNVWHRFYVRLSTTF